MPNCVSTGEPCWSATTRRTSLPQTHIHSASPASACQTRKPVDHIYRLSYALQASMLECYNEEYRDLLGKGPPAGKKHSVRSQAIAHVHASNREMRAADDVAG